MSDRSRVESLVARWEEARDGGAPVAVEILCEDAPDLINPVKAALRMLHGSPHAPARPRPAGEAPEAPPTRSRACTTWRRATWPPVS